MNHVRLSVVAFFFLSACRGSQNEQPSAAAPASTPAPPAAVPMAAAPDRTVPMPSGKPLGASIGAILATEGSSRPTGTPRAEDVFALFARNGVAVQDQKQHLGAPVGARYCMGGTTESGVALSVCEYVDAAAAEAGKALSTKAFAQMANRDIAIRKSSTLTILATPATRAEAKKLFSWFEQI